MLRKNHFTVGDFIKIYCLILLFIPCFIRLHGNDKSQLFLFSCPTNYSLNYYRGFFTDKQKTNYQVINQYINGFNISLMNTPDGSKEWHSVYRYPETGYEFFYIHTGNPQIMGSIFSLARFVDFHIYHHKTLDVDCRASLGAAYVTKTFHPTENHSNIFFSRPFNFFFQFNLNAEYKIQKNSDLYLNGGLSLFHVSNGETRLPNEGVSAFSFFFGLSKKNLSQKHNETLDPLSYHKKILISVLPTFGWKENWRYGSKKYLELSFSSDFLYRLNKKQLIGLGTDLFYDETRKAYSNHNTEPVTTNREALSGGIHIAHELNLAPLYIVFKTGLHLINKEIVRAKNYNLVGIKYNILPVLYICLYHKSHDLFYGDNIQWGIGADF